MVKEFIVVFLFARKQVFDMTDCWILYKQIPEDYKVVSIFPSIENGGFDHNSILQFIADTKLSKTATVEKALEEYINKYNKTGKI